MVNYDIKHKESLLKSLIRISDRFRTRLIVWILIQLIRNTKENLEFAMETFSINILILANFHFFFISLLLLPYQNIFKLLALFIITMSWSCFKAEAFNGRRSAQIVALKCNFCVIVKALKNVCVRFHFITLFINSPSLQIY